MSRHSNTPVALQVLHYATPILVFLYYTLARAAASCFLHKPTKKSEQTRRYAATTTLLLVNATVVAQAIAYFVESLAHPGYWATQDCVVYVLGSVFAYGSLTLGLLEARYPVWHPLLGSCLAGVALEIPTTVLQAVTQSNGDDFAFSRLALQVSRCILLVCFCVSGGWYTLHERLRSRQDGDEAEPLLSATANGHATKTNYAAVPGSPEDHDNGDSTDEESDTEETDQVKELKKQQRKRLRQTGGWLGYSKEFKIFIPMLWPSKDRFVQACLVVIGIVLVAERFLNVLIPRQLGIITDELTKGNGNGDFPLRAVSIWMLLSWLGSRAGVYTLQSLAELPVQQFAYKSIGATSFSHIMGLSMEFHNEKNSGELIRAISQGQNLQGLLEFVCFRIGPVFVDLAIAFIYVYLLFDIYMSFILAFVGIAYIWVGAKTTAWSVKRRRRFNTAYRNESKIQNEAINNWQTVSHFNRGKYECDRYSGSIDAFNKAEMKYYIAYFMGGGAQSLIMVLGRLAATFLAIYRVSQGAAPVGNFVALTAYWRSIESPMAQVSWSIRKVTSMLTDSERLLQLFQTKPSVTDAPNAVPLYIKSGEVKFDDVDFSYDVRKSTLKAVSFTAKPGQTVALVGETGGGKSTILKLLYRYYDVSGGSIRVDGQDIRGVTLDSLRDSFGMVPQDPALFNISIMENVRYARLDATDDEVKEACRAAAIHDKIEAFPDGYKATVGERGVKLSGGELQRVSIARAILRGPHIVLLDEATSMIDAETEATIQEAFKRLTASRTTFIIAHRLSTIQHADLILVINDGQVVERGTHDELFRLNGKYVALWSKQLSKDVKDIGNTLHVDGNDPALIDLGQ
ncbi:hypothetical protein LTR37_008842 [Vermiconidia calcicola]|uniref:Uncharacterized protein n=1 Tax=Vermiconidia calcicola TaxID=1690605 RepID=A0ACC3NAX1_9PEZI|nr:hypothetical protein LTR37_008842 [Vermiconidia calcicola]